VPADAELSAQHNVEAVQRSLLKEGGMGYSAHASLLSITSIITTSVLARGTYLL
jgi:hypothetical protein